MDKRIGSEFIISKYKLDYEKQAIHFFYEIRFEDEKVIELKETLSFPIAFTQDICNRVDCKAAIESLHILLGMSYFKMFIPRKISVPYALSQQQADFWNTLYTRGLGEFFYVNNLDFRGLVNFPVSSQLSSTPISSQFSSSRALVLHGGGKDSLVSVEITKQAQIDFDLLSLNTSAIQDLAAEAIGKAPHVVGRHMDSKMFALNESGEAYNGHVSITMIYSFVAILYALMAQYRYVVLSNETSANYGNADYLGMKINHQWSKSLEAEILIAEYVKTHMSLDIEYFSLLRPLHEISIVQMFCHFKNYFEKFSSSNHNFTQIQGKQGRWDIEYSKGKVEFIFALFTAFLTKDEVLRIFGDNFYSYDNLIERFKELLGVKGIKPLDCVGGPEEIIVAMSLAQQRGEYAHEPIMEYFEKNVLPSKDVTKLSTEVFAYGDDSRIPALYRHKLREMYDKRV